MSIGKAKENKSLKLGFGAGTVSTPNRSGSLFVPFSYRFLIGHEDFKMAKVTGVFTGIKGKVGNVVYSTWKGIQVMKTRTIPHNPQSAPQTAVREVFAKLIMIGKQLTTAFLPKVYNDLAVGSVTGWSNWLSQNLKTQIAGAFDPETLIFGLGSLFQPGIESAILSGGAVSINFDAEVLGDSFGSDFVYGIIFDDVSHQIFLGDPSILREDAETIVQVTGENFAANLNAYLVFYRQNQVEETISVSNTAWLQVTETP